MIALFKDGSYVEKNNLLGVKCKSDGSRPIKIICKQHEDIRAAAQYLDVKVDVTKALMVTGLSSEALTFSEILKEYMLPSDGFTLQDDGNYACSSKCGQFAAIKTPMQTFQAIQENLRYKERVANGLGSIVGTLCKESKGVIADDS